MRLLLPFLLLHLLCVSNAEAAGKSTTEDLQEWVMTYFRNLQPDQVVAVVKGISAEGVLKKRSSALPMLAFLTEVIKDNPDSAALWCSQFADLPEMERVGLALAYASSRIPAAKSCMEKGLQLPLDMREALEKGRKIQPLQDAVSGPADLDMLWATFFASGNELAVHKIIDVLGGTDPNAAEGVTTSIDLTQGAAEWSLRSNATHYPEVAAIVDARLKSETNPRIRAELEKIRPASPAQKKAPR